MKPTRLAGKTVNSSPARPADQPGNAGLIGKRLAAVIALSIMVAAASTACAADKPEKSKATTADPEKPEQQPRTDPTGGMTPEEREAWLRRYLERQEHPPAKR